MTQDNTYNVDPNNPQTQAPEIPLVANPLNTGNGGFETGAQAAPAAPTIEVAPVQMPDNRPHPIEMQTSTPTPQPETVAMPTPQPEMTQAPTSEVPQAQPETVAMPAPQPEMTQAPTSEPARVPVVPSITEPNTATPTTTNLTEAHKESRAKSYILASIVVVGLSAFGFIGYKFFFNNNATVSDENIEEGLELNNSLSSDTSSKASSSEESTTAEEIFIPESTPSATEKAATTEEPTATEKPVVTEEDKMKELDAVVSELKEIYAPESEVSEEATLTEIPGEPDKESSGIER